MKEKITIKTKEEIAILREGGRRHAKILKYLEGLVAPGVSSYFLESEARRLIEEGGDKPAFLDYTPSGASRPYPAALCLSLNDEIVHGIPNEREKILKEGDIVSLDLGLVHKGLYTDMAVTVPVGKVAPELEKLIAKTKEALYKGIEKARSGVKSGEISFAIEQIARKENYGVVRELSGHGVGYGVHEDPFVPNYGSRDSGMVLKAGMVLAIEPMFNLGKRYIYLDDDGYTYKTKDRLQSAHFECTIVVTDSGFEILTK